MPWRTVPLDDEITLTALRHELVGVASALVVDSLAHGVAGLPAPVPQQGEATTAEKISKEDLRLEWTRTALELTRVVRLGRAWTTFRGKRLTVLDAALAPRPDNRDDGVDTATGATPGTLEGPVVATGDGQLLLREVQPESRSPMSAEEWLRGVRPAVGERLGTD